MRARQIWPWLAKMLKMGVSRLTANRKRRFSCPSWVPPELIRQAVKVLRSQGKQLSMFLFEGGKGAVKTTSTSAVPELNEQRRFQWNWLIKLTLTSFCIFTDQNKMLLWIEWPATFPENVWDYIDIILLPPFKSGDARYQITLFWCWWFWVNTSNLRLSCNFNSARADTFLFMVGQITGKMFDHWKRLCFRSIRSGHFPDQSGPGTSRTGKCCNLKSSCTASHDTLH